MEIPQKRPKAIISEDQEKGTKILEQQRETNVRSSNIILNSKVKQMKIRLTLVCNTSLAPPSLP